MQCSVCGKSPQHIGFWMCPAARRLQIKVLDRLKGWETRRARTFIPTKKIQKDCFDVSVTVTIMVYNCKNIYYPNSNFCSLLWREVRCSTAALHIRSGSMRSMWVGEKSPFRTRELLEKQWAFEPSHFDKVSLWFLWRFSVCVLHKRYIMELIEIEEKARRLVVQAPLLVVLGLNFEFKSWSLKGHRARKTSPSDWGRLGNFTSASERCGPRICVQTSCSRCSLLYSTAMQASNVQPLFQQAEYKEAAQIQTDSNSSNELSPLNQMNRLNPNGVGISGGAPKLRGLHRPSELSSQRSPQGRSPGDHCNVQSAL